ncbi:MAG: VWA domain-containing protein [Marinifilum sp.]|jgi:uncharacterized protein (TIGR02145 family)|nr:VWA domain-containing protein [Marinifilum sp.]
MKNSQSLILSILFVLINSFYSCEKSDIDNNSNESSYKLKKHFFTSKEPCLINVMFQVTNLENKGVDNLSTENFEVYEDSKKVSPTESYMSIKKREAISYKLKTVLMLDNSASVGANINEIKKAAISIIDKKVKQQEIAICVFSEKPILITGYTSNTEELKQAVKTISLGYPTTNLYGSVSAGVNLWSDSYSLNYITQGFMILITDGSDTQGSSSLNKALKNIGDKKVYTIGVGNEQDKVALEQLGTADYFALSSYSQLANKFIDIQNEIEAYANSFYWLSYMSPTRKDHDHTLELKVINNQNIGEEASILETFNSNGFYSVPVGLSINNGINSLNIHENGSSILEANNYFTSNQPNYSWQSSNENIISVEISKGDNSRIKINAKGNVGDKSNITVTDNRNSTNKTITVTIIESPFGEFKDTRDGRIYKTIKIGNQTWLAENLKFKPSTGYAIYNNDESLIETYGYHYSWSTAQNVAPTGWHLPSTTEWNELFEFLGGKSIAGGKLKQTGYIYWDHPNQGATNESNFSALAGGIVRSRDYSVGLGFNARFWTTDGNAYSGDVVNLYDFTSKAYMEGYNYNGDYFSVRCIKD